MFVGPEKATPQLKRGTPRNPQSVQRSKAVMSFTIGTEEQWELLMSHIITSLKKESIGKILKFAR